MVEDLAARFSQTRRHWQVVDRGCSRTGPVRHPSADRGICRTILPYGHHALRLCDFCDRFRVCIRESVSSRSLPRVWTFYLQKSVASGSGTTATGLRLDFSPVAEVAKSQSRGWGGFRPRPPSVVPSSVPTCRPGEGAARREGAGERKAALAQRRSQTRRQCQVGRGSSRTVPVRHPSAGRGICRAILPYGHHALRLRGVFVRFGGCRRESGWCPRSLPRV
jgi:hypothetical protein